MKRLFLAVLLITSVFLAGCTSQRDGDGMDSNLEANGWSVRVQHANGTVLTYDVTSDPTIGDTDGDGLNDFQEFQRGSDPRNLDTDGDRLLDGPMQCDPDQDLLDKILELGILEHPEKEGCYLGEARWELGDMIIKTEPHNANSDSNPTITDNLLDGEEIEGWTVDLGSRTYEVRSNPSIGSTDTDGDGLNDGAERSVGSDPTKKDTDGDGVLDPKDAAPLGNLVITVELSSIELKRDYKALGGADLRIDLHVAGLERTIGPMDIDKGQNSLEITRRLDVDDVATSFDNGGAGAGHYETDIILLFWHAEGGGDDKIKVSGQGDKGHALRLTYDAFEEAWTGATTTGSSSGPDAEVTFDLTTQIDTTD